MNYEQSHRRLISGQSSGIGASLLRALLGIASIGYSLVVWLRNSLYSRGLLKARRVDATVICIGNITVGGTGKTPLVVWLCEQMAPHRRCAILTRGYKSAQSSKAAAQNQGQTSRMMSGASHPKKSWKWPHCVIRMSVITLTSHLARRRRPRGRAHRAA